MRRPLVKFCGFRTAAEVQDAVQIGCDLIGLNFYPRSPRAVSVEEAIELADVARRAASERQREEPLRVVALFVNAEQDLIREVIAQVQPDLIQFHGDESAKACASHGTPYLKAFRLRHPEDCEQISDYMGALAWGFLIDGYTDSARGGTGVQVPMTLARHALDRDRGFLAGGLHADNVGHAIRSLSPFGVDVASGVEDTDGKKCPRRMAAFMRAVDVAVSTPHGFG